MAYSLSCLVFALVIDAQSICTTEVIYKVGLCLLHKSKMAVSREITLINKVTYDILVCIVSLHLNADTSNKPVRSCHTLTE